MFVYGVDERFWRFHGLDPRDGTFVSPALAAELGAASRDVLLTRLQKPSEIPLESLFAHKEDIGRTIRLTLEGTLPREQLGEFTLRPQQGDVRAIFAPLARRPARPRCQGSGEHISRCRRRRRAIVAATPFAPRSVLTIWASGSRQ